MKTAYPQHWSLTAASWLLIMAMLSAVVGQQLLTTNSIKARQSHLAAVAHSAKAVKLSSGAHKQPEKANLPTGTELHQAQAPGAPVSTTVPAFLEFIRPDVIPYSIGVVRAKLIVHAQYALRMPVLLTRCILRTSIVANAP